MTTLTDAATRLLAEAAEWHLLSLLVARPAPAWHSTLASLAGDPAIDPELRGIAEAARQTTEGAYLAAFGPGGVVSPRETAHRRTDPGLILSELTGAYEAFAYRPVREEPPDHLTVEAGFVAYLRMKEAFARASKDEDAADLTAEAAAAFLERHLSTFVEPVAGRLQGLADAYLSDSLQALLLRTGRRRPDVEGGWSPDGLDAALACGGCPTPCEAEVPRSE